jgi:hypothetical protein
MMKTDEQTITRVLDAMVRAYPGRFEIVPGQKQIWLSLLSDLPADAVYGATTQLVAVSKWPPSVADVRRLAVNLTRGRLAPPSPWEAWERVQRKVAGEEIELTGNEARALKIIGGTHTLRTSTAIAFERKSFCDAFESFETADLREAIALNDVKQLAESNSPPMPQLPERTETAPVEHRAAEPERVREMLEKLPGYREQFPAGEER